MSFLNNINWSPIDYADSAVVAREVGAEMLARLDLMTINPNVILDLGCGIGAMSALLQQRYPQARVLAFDQSDAMLRYSQAARQVEACGNINHVNADASKLPLRAHSVDLVFANFLFPWQDDFNVLLRECRRVLKPEGLLLLTALGLDTLREWRELLPAEQLPLLIDMHDVGDVLLQEGFSDPVLDVNYFSLKYRDKNRLFSELRASGMWFPPAEVSVTPALPDDKGSWSVTYEVIYAHAFLPAAKEERSASADGLVRIPLAQLKKKLKQTSS